MHNIPELFLKNLESFPEFLDVKDLVTLGIYSHKNLAYRARKDGSSPSYIKMRGKVLYPKEVIRSFILDRFRDGSIPMENKKTSESSK